MQARPQSMPSQPTFPVTFSLHRYCLSNILECLFGFPRFTSSALDDNEPLHSALLYVDLDLCWLRSRIQIIWECKTPPLAGPDAEARQFISYRFRVIRARPKSGHQIRWSTCRSVPTLRSRLRESRLPFHRDAGTFR